jgi:hypothetical protein
MAHAAFDYNDVTNWGKITYSRDDAEISDIVIQEPSNICPKCIKSFTEWWNKKL